MGTIRRAAIYCRISSDREGLALGVTRQLEDCKKLAVMLSLVVDEIHVYIENDRGASTRSRKSRPKYKAMMEAAERGEFDMILAYSNSRLTRRPLELEDIVSLYERSGIEINTVVSGKDDLSTADGRMVARIKAAVDAAEAERVAERVSRMHLAYREAGKPVGGTRPFGWEVDKATLHPEEADALLLAATNLILGKSLNKCATELNEAGFETTRSNPWIGKTLRLALLNPRVAGWRAHKGEVVKVEGVPVRGQWEPLMDQDMYDRLVGKLKRAEGRARIPRPGARHYMLSGLMRCGICNATMFGMRRTDERHDYVCSSERIKTHSMSAAGNAIERLVTTQILLKLDEVNLDVPEPTFEGAERLAEIDVLIAEAMAELRKGGKGVSSSVVFAHVSSLEEEKVELEVDRAEWLETTIGPVHARITPEEWSSLDVAERRAYVEKFLDAIVVKPATRHSRVFDPNRLVYVWRADAPTPQPVAQ